jgi:threonine/homoserine/homoserine lactone efflux protein
VAQDNPVFLRYALHAQWQGSPMESIAAFALTAFLIELTPGPNMAYLALVAATEGRKRGYAAVAGVAVGLGVLGLLAAFGVAALIAASPVAYQVLRWGGVAYLFWLAWQGWQGAEQSEGETAVGASLWVWFRRGLVTNLLNPKAAVFYVAVLPHFLQPGDGFWPTLTRASVYVAIATAVHAMIVTLAGAAHAVLAVPARERLVRRALSLALVGVAIWLVFKT